MEYMLNVFYQVTEGAKHIQVPVEKLCDYVGQFLANQILTKVSFRMTERTMPEIREFFEHGGKKLIAAESTSRGNVYIEAVEKEPAQNAESVKMSKVNVRYRVDTGNEYYPIKYRQHTFELVLPKNDYGFIQIGTLENNLRVLLTQLEPYSSDIRVLNHQILQNYA